MSAEDKGIGRDVRHDEAADEHDKDTKSYERDGRDWSLSGDPEKADLDRRDADVSYDAAGVDRAKVMNGAAAMTQTRARVSATTPAERGPPSIAAISPKKCPSLNSFRIISCPPLVRMTTRTSPSAMKKTSRASSPASSTVWPGRKTRQHAEAARADSAGPAKG